MSHGEGEVSYEPFAFTGIDHHKQPYTAGRTPSYVERVAFRETTLHSSLTVKQHRARMDEILDTARERVTYFA
jgi:hypothetical protein